MVYAMSIEAIGPIQFFALVVNFWAQGKYSTCQSHITVKSQNNSSLYPHTNSICLISSFTQPYSRQLCRVAKDWKGKLTHRTLH